MKKLQSLLKKEQGNILVLFALSLTMLIGITAIVIDGGRLYHEKSVLQNAMDAAALGGAQGLLISEAKAAEIATDLSDKNKFTIDSTNMTITGNSIEVYRDSTVSMTFAKVMGFDTADVKARAKAILSKLLHSERVTPIAIEKNAIPTNKLNCENTDTYSGNCGFVRVDGAKGAQDLKKAIINGAEYSVGKNPYTEPGDILGPVQKAVKELIDQDAGKACNTAEEALATEKAGGECARIITILVVETLDLSGSDQVTVIGFADYFLEGMANVETGPDGEEIITFDKEGDRIIGEFIQIRYVEDVGAGGSYEDYLLQGVKLVE